MEAWTEAFGSIIVADQANSTGETRLKCADRPSLGQAVEQRQQHRETLDGEALAGSSKHHSSDAKTREDVHVDAEVERACSQLRERSSSGQQQPDQMQSLDGMVTSVHALGARS